jgi:pSer/pThr/pTyr-binding forkhead associated (FHA) protein
VLGSVAVEEALLILKLVFLVGLYLFIWRIVRAASRDLRLPQESFILKPQQAAGLLGRSQPVQTGRLVVVRSPALNAGDIHVLDSSTLTIGRGAQNDVSVAADTFASSSHARVEPRRDGIWISDDGSTNGTFVNGTRITEPRKLKPGDVVRVGETDLRYER